MRVVITGGSGRVGSYVVPELLAAGHEVTVFDLRPPKSDRVAHIDGSVLDLAACREAFEGAEAVVHLAAIPHPMSDPPERVFEVNTMGTWHVHQAAAEAGARRVIHASSDSTYGYVFRKHEIPVDYLPIDEDYPQRPQDPYGLSKVAGEHIARAFSDGQGLETVALRICWVWTPDQPEAYRKVTQDPDAWWRNLWVYNDARDAAQAFRLAIETPGLLCERFCIAAADNGTEADTLELFARHYGDVALRKPIEGRQSPIDTSRAAERLGYRPRHSWRDWVQ